MGSGGGAVREPWTLVSSLQCGPHAHRTSLKPYTVVHVVGASSSSYTVEHAGGQISIGRRRMERAARPGIHERPMATCGWCGGPFRPEGVRKHCSPACTHAAEKARKQQALEQKAAKARAMAELLRLAVSVWWPGAPRTRPSTRFYS